MSTVFDRCDVVLVGGGVVGCALARELAERGARVAVVERAEPGSEASGAAAGMLSPQAESTERTPFFDLCLASRELHRVWARELAGETGIEVGYRRCGVLRCDFDEEAARLAEAFSWQRAEGLAVEPLDASSAAARTEKRISDGVRGALFFPEDGLVDSARLTHALAVSARARGARIHVGETVRRCLLRGGRCVGVETGSGALSAGQVVITAGAWSGFDTGLPFA
ncbi:MAG TPA: FAD-dependent oxidoreductase, partial [Thermoanaerobaculia bacterium]|nr:FAD-dependent oxidoreductase [Thermoanaerobaculia bacterium]